MNAVLLCTRQSSTRLPGKGLVEISGRSVLEHVVYRYYECTRVDEVIVCTSDQADDDAIEDEAERLEVPCYRGSLENVVQRMNCALLKFAPDADYVFRGLGDMPLFDVGLLDWRFDLLERHSADVCWIGHRDDPLPVYGSRESPWSRRAWDEIVKQSRGDELEHAGQWLYSHLRDFHVLHIDTLPEEYYQPLRLELDTPADLDFFRQLYDELWYGPGKPSTMDALRWLQRNPDVAQINAKVATKTLTSTNFKRRGSEWVCKECGSPAFTGVAHRKSDYAELETFCQRCGATRTFHPVPAFVARRKR
jgi:spore coat polysaccharide biosynthesis protein SpsF